MKYMAILPHKNSHQSSKRTFQTYLLRIIIGKIFKKTPGRVTNNNTKDKRPKQCHAWWVNNLYFWLRFIFVYQKSLKRTFKTGFWVQNHLLNLCSRAVNSQRLLCSQRAGVRIKAFWYTNSVSFFYCTVW